MATTSPTGRSLNIGTLVLATSVLLGCGSSEGEYVEFRKTETVNPGTPPLDAAHHDATVTEPAQLTTNSSSASDASTPATTIEPATTETATVQIVSPQTGLTGQADVPVIDNAAPVEVRPIELLIPHKHFRRERGTSAVRVSYDDIDLLKVLNMEPVPPNAGDYFPDWLKSLDGKPIRIRGFMYPVHVATGITSFTLARDNAICCFQRNPKVYDVILVKLAEGESTDYIDLRPFDVEGTFRIDSTPDEVELPRLYRIENARVLN